jgi:hypothetical protein
MKLGGNVISTLALTLAAAICGVPAPQAVSPSATTSPSAHSSHKSAHGSTDSPHHKGTHTTKTTSHHHQTSKPSHTAQKTSASTAHQKAPAHRSTAYTRLAHMEMDPARVENIQKALIDAGEMHGTPTGRWDSETRGAMAHYQTDNGFGVTGLPDAKSLMKLGLGPHPLPPQLEKTRPPTSTSATGDAALPANPALGTPAAPAPLADPPAAAGADPPVKR